MRSVWIAITLLSPIAAAELAASPYLLAAQPHLSEIEQLIDEGNRQRGGGELDEAIATFQSALLLIESSENRSDIRFKSTALYGLGKAYLRAGDYATALPTLEAGLALVASNEREAQGIASDLADSPNAGEVINFSGAIAETHQWLGHLGSALNYYRQALAGGAIVHEQTRAVLLFNTGLIEIETGQYQQAEQTLDRAITLHSRLENQQGEASAMLSQGWLYEKQGDLARAIDNYESAIALYQQVGNLPEEIDTLSILGAAYVEQGNLIAARETLDKGLLLLETQTDLFARSQLLSSLGQLYQKEGDSAQAWSVYLEGLQISTQRDSKVDEIAGALNLAAVMEAIDRPALAIFFYKRAIVDIETVRDDLRTLDVTVQQKYAATVEDFYRQLAKLLLQQNRTAEALQILELLKLQEVKAYFHSDPTTDQARNRTDNQLSLYTPAEARLNSALETILESPSILELADFLQLSEVGSVTSEMSADPDAFDLRVIESLQSALSAQPVGTAALYPLVLPDRLELILITSAGPPIHHTVSVSESELTQTVGKLQSQLMTDSLEPTVAAQQLYGWLVKPLDPSLKAQSIENIIYLPDSVLRYVPLAALHDGNQWLAQKYQSHNITAASVDRLTQPRSLGLTVVAGALTEDSPTHRVNIGQEQFPFDGLSGAKQEVDLLATVMPDTVALFDRSFTPRTILDAASDRHIVHLATHAKFLPGQPEDSFVLFGDGSIVTMRELGQWQLPNVELVVFSACQTATNVEGDGKEILGLGFQMQQTGAHSAIASLWAVDDIATAALMNQFYIALSEGKSKAEALQQAQTKLIENQRFRHPYNWAGFILIGNGL
ncbi:CHAT domain-containing protein [cf. Phormidesmis sp. LEGE 11477]|uniref:CHAT domain-containing protein n=1 Tax=cf. Phormidesmis sp. LEGE 11477 TaxID=1828680 RepID=UPI0018808466|nr:CHAT domain-containing protein [cf. Phormidesmis sp. LEGE 11477]MBE9059490.1 CHAT domain-containing protein [cf. Phormidesmis sp. LEGE 11477]